MTLDSVVASEYLASFASESPGLILLFQAGRGVLWALLTLPLTQVVNGRRWKTGLAISSLYAVLMGSSLLLPNEVLPASIQLAHLAEVITANFIFGWVITWLWTQRVSQRHVEAMASPSVMPLR